MSVIQWIVGPRRSGKTTKTINLAGNNDWILVCNNVMKKNIKVKNPKSNVITISELMGRRINFTLEGNLHIEEVEYVLIQLIKNLAPNLNIVSANGTLAIDKLKNNPEIIKYFKEWGEE